MVCFSLTVVRHGETDANAQQIIQGQIDEPLNERGKEQARLLGRLLRRQRRPAFTHVFCSDLRRAKLTANLVLREFQPQSLPIDVEEDGDVAQTSAAGSTSWNSNNNNSIWLNTGQKSPSSGVETSQLPVEIEYDERLRERAYGEFERRTSVELRAAAEKAGKKVLEFTCAGGESLSQLADRAKDFFVDMCQQMVDEEEERRRMAVINSISDQLIQQGRQRHSSSGGAVFRSTASRPSPLTNCAAGNSQKNGKQRPASTSHELLSSNSNGIDRAPDSAVHEDEEVSSDDREVDEACTSHQNSRRRFFVETPPPPSLGPSGSGYRAGVAISSSVDSGVPNDDVQVLLDRDHQLLEVQTPATYPTGTTGVESESLAMLPSPSSWWSRGLFSSGSGNPVDEDDQRKQSCKSIASDDSFIPPVDAHALLVAHGGWIRELLRHLCDLDPLMHRGTALRGTPNTGLCRFMITVDPAGSPISVTCLDLHCRDHLDAIDGGPT